MRQILWWLWRCRNTPIGLLHWSCLLRLAFKHCEYSILERNKFCVASILYWQDLFTYDVHDLLFLIFIWYNNYLQYQLPKCHSPNYNQTPVYKLYNLIDTCTWAHLWLFYIAENIFPVMFPLWAILSFNFMQNKVEKLQGWSYRFTTWVTLNK